MENNTSGIHFLFKYNRLLLIALLIGGLSGFIVTFFIPKKYTSTAIVFPYNSHTKNEIISNPQFGFEIETEQLMQLMESKSMRDRTIAHFKLYKYYDLDTNDQTWQSEITKEYIEDVTFFRSKYLSVVINVSTKNPELSAKIANFQVEEVDRYRAKIFDHNRKTEFLHVEAEFITFKKEMEDLRDSIYAIKTDKSQLLYNFIENLNNENYDPSDFIDDPKLESYIDRYIYKNSRFKELRDKYDRMKLMLEEPLPTVYSIDQAEPNYKKVSPSFSLNILLGAVIFFILALTIRLILDKWASFSKEIN